MWSLQSHRNSLGTKLKVLDLQSLDTKTVHKDLLKKVSREFDTNLQVPLEPCSSPSEQPSTVSMDSNTYRQKVRSHKSVETMMSEEETEQHLQDLNVIPFLFYR